MIIKSIRPLLFPDDAVVAAPTVEQKSTTTTPSPKNVATVREPTADEKKVEFKLDPSLFSSDDQALVVPPDLNNPEQKLKTEIKPEVKKIEPAIVEKVKEEVAKTEKKEEPKIQVPVKAKEEVKPTAEKKAANEPILPPSTKPAARNYDGFSTEEVAALKATPNASFDFFVSQLKEKKELEKLKGAQFVQHPNAFVLDPAYQQLNTDSVYYQKEAQYWQEQLIAIEEGKEWCPLVKWENGKPVFGEMRKPTTADKIAVGQVMNQCSQLAQQSQQQLQQFVGNYQQRIQQDTLAINAERAKWFGWVADPKQLDATLDIPEVGTKSIKDIRSEFIGRFPSYLQNTQGVEVAADCYAAMECLKAQLREAQNGKQVAEIKAEEVVLAEPTSANGKPATGKAIDGVVEFSSAGMPT